MQVWVDADACPREIKQLLFRAAQRRQVTVTLVANQALSVPRSPYIHTVIVPAGLNVADQQILDLVEPGDLVITADIPLAAEVLTKAAEALNPRGELYTDARIGERLVVRNLLEEQRAAGEITGGPSNFTAQDKQAFANQFDRWLTRARPLA